MTVNNDMTMRVSGQQPAFTPAPAENTNRQSESSQQFANVQSRESSNPAIGQTTGSVEGALSAAQKEMLRHGEIRLMNELVKAVNEHRGGQVHENRALDSSNSPEENEGKKLARVYDFEVIAPMERAIAEGKDKLTKLILVPGDGVTEKEREVKLEFADEMQAAITDYKKSLDTGPNTKDAVIETIEAFRAKAKEAREKARDKMEKIEAARTLETLLKKVKGLEEKQNREAQNRSPIYQIVRLFNPVNWFSNVGNDPIPGQVR